MKQLSTDRLLAALPIPVVIYDTSGAIIAAGSAFWPVTGCLAPVCDLQQLTDRQLASTLQQLASANGDSQEGQLWYRGPEGYVRIVWRHLCDNGQPLVAACLVREPFAPPPLRPGAGAGQQGAAGPMPTAHRDLPDAATTMALLEQALTACREQDVPLSIACLSVRHENGQPIHTTHYETWCGIGRKLRTACRLSDLVGVGDAGDFVMILLNCSLSEAQAVTHRVLGQLTDWVHHQLPAPVVLGAGYSTWTPESDGLSAEELLERAAIRIRPEQASS